MRMMAVDFEGLPMVISSYFDGHFISFCQFIGHCCWNILIIEIVKVVVQRFIKIFELCYKKVPLFFKVLSNAFIRIKSKCMK
jgi:hypothetical protein